MRANKLTDYQQASAPLPGRNRLWPLYGAGLDNLGHSGQPIEVPMPDYGPDELLVRHDACSLCFSDIKVIRLGQEHPRIYRDIQSEPAVLGHKVSMTVVGVGENLHDRFHIPDDLHLMLHQAETGQLSPNRSVAAIGSLSAARDGLQAVQDTVFPGKVVIYPHIKEMPLTALSDLKDRLPSVYTRLKDGREWTVEAEKEFLRLMLPWSSNLP